MKKTLILGAAILGLAAMSSCKKEYTCNCEGSNEFVDYSGTVVVKATKNNAADACADESGPTFGGVDRVCTLAE